MWIFSKFQKGSESSLQRQRWHFVWNPEKWRRTCKVLGWMSETQPQVLGQIRIPSHNPKNFGDLAPGPPQTPNAAHPASNRVPADHVIGKWPAPLLIG
jgi:hypothetical protein